MKKIKIVFMGTPDYATTILEEILQNNIEVLAVFTQPDKPVGRKQILTAPHVKDFLLQNYPEIKIFQPKNLKDKQTAELIKEMVPDFIVVAAYGQILPKEILDIAPCINLHASILPKYRGASPIQSAILNREKQTGVTSMLMDIGLDTGDMLEFSYADCEEKSCKELFDELSKKAAKLCVNTLKNFYNITPKKQDENEATYCTKIKKNMGLFSFEDSADEIYVKFKALTPWPGIFLESGLKIIDLSFLDKNGNAGEVLEIKKESFIVGCKRGSVEIFALQEPSKKQVNSASYINGKRIKVGDRIS